MKIGFTPFELFRNAQSEDDRKMVAPMARDDLTQSPMTEPKLVQPLEII